MVPSLIVKITWHLPGGRYHSPSIITADRGRGHAHQRLNQCRARKWPMDLLLRRSAGVSTRRERPPLVSDVHRPTDLPGCVPPGGYRAGLRRLEEQRHSQRQQVSRRRRGSVLRASCDTRCFGDDAGGHGPSTTVAGGRLEPKRSRRATGPQARHAPQGDPAGTTDQALSARAGESAPEKPRLQRMRNRPPSHHGSSDSGVSSRPPPPTSPRGPSKMPRPKWARRAPGRTNASWRHSVFWTGRRPVLKPAATSPSAACCAPCRLWRRMACFDTSTIAWHNYAATTARCT